MWKRNPLVYLFRKTWRYSEGNRKNVLFFWLLFILAELTSLFFQPLIWAKIMNIIQQEGITIESFTTLSFFLVLTLVATLLFWSFHGPGRVLEQVNAFRARINYRKYLLKGVMTLPLVWHADHHSGDTIDKVEKGTGGLYSFSADSFQIIYSIVNLLGSYMMIVYFSKPAAYIVFGMLIISFWITIRFDNILMGQYRELNHNENQISESVFDAISNITTVIILRVEKLVFKAIVGKVEKPLSLFERNTRLSETKWFLTNVCGTVMTIIVMMTYLWQNIGTDKGVLIGSVYLLTNYLREINEILFKFTSLYSDIVKEKVRVMNSEELTSDFKSENFTNHVLPQEWKSLGVENLNFSYDGSNEEGSLHLEGVNLTIKRRTFLAFVGLSGSGKTTLLKLFRDLYQPHTLRLSVDGVEIPHGFEGISRAISLVPQNPEIFKTTILENITLGADYNLDFVRKFTDMACFTNVADGLPKGFNSGVKEKGVNLSGGEQQRLALSRGLLACHDKDIVLLDEPTSSLDVATEMSVYQNIFSGFSDKTIISSIHRLHLLPMFHRIFMFEGGRIIASGNLSELLSGCPEFRTLWESYHKEKQVAD